MLSAILETHGRVGLGGEGILRTHDRLAEARQVIQAAIDQGITYFDSAHVYADSEVYYGSVWGEFPERRIFLKYPIGIPKKLSADEPSFGTVLPDDSG